MSELHLPTHTLVVVATGEEAKLLTWRGKRLESTGEWSPQNMADEGPSGKSPPERSAKESMEATFSKQIAEHLYSYAHKGKYSDLILIADPETLGEIRPLLHDEVTSKILLELNKTLINAPVSDIERSIAAAMELT